MIEVPRRSETVITVSSDPANPRVGREVTLRFVVVTKTIAPDDTVESEDPATSRQISITDNDNWKFSGGKTGVTGSDGSVQFKATCEEDGVHKATVELGWIKKTVELPACGDLVKPDPSEPAVGDTLEVPVVGAVPAGTYQSTESGCETTYQLWVLGDWAEKRKRARGSTMVLPNVARDLQPASGTDGCTYERTK
jgi:hypothetical protein